MLMFKYKKYDGNQLLRHKRAAFRKKIQNLHSKRSALDWTVFAADIFGNLGHGFVVGQPLWVLQLIQVLDDPVRIG